MSCPANYNDHPLSDTGLAAPIGHVVIGSKVMFIYEAGRGGGYIVVDDGGCRLDGFSYPLDSDEAAPLLARALVDALDAS